MNAEIDEAIAQTKRALNENPDSHWIIGFSGGKDSTCLLKIFASAADKHCALKNPIDLIYCDTGVENPALDRYVKNLFAKLEVEFISQRLPFRTKVLKAPVNDRFFVKIIGRGYPPPTNSFRWCTKNLRIKPVSNFIQQSIDDHAIVALGIRSAESNQRDRSIEKNGGGIWQSQMEAGRKYDLFLPILNLCVDDVWEGIMELDKPRSIDGYALAELYRGASGECPIIKGPKAPPCGSGRFGCWTCTVVRKDHSAMRLIDAGHVDLKPYLEFRNWLVDIRNDPDRRWPVRRNGTARLGPFTLSARQEILSELDKLERCVGEQILSGAERHEIQRLWALDENHEPV